MSKTSFSVTYKEPLMVQLVNDTDHKTLAVWARDCTERVMQYFEAEHPDDQRPRQAVETLQEWIQTGEFSMAVIRGASLASHAAAREVGEDNAARSAARAAGQAVATAHVPAHSIGAANYAVQAIHRATGDDSDVAISNERDWQIEHLRQLRTTSALG